MGTGPSDIPIIPLLCTRCKLSHMKYSLMIRFIDVLKVCSLPVINLATALQRRVFRPCTDLKTDTYTAL